MEELMKHTKRVFVNRGLLIGGIILTFIETILCLLFAALIWFEVAHTATNTQRALCSLFFIILGFLSVGGALIALPTWASHIVLAPDKITLVSPFKKRVEVSYIRYKYIQIGSYRHFGTLVNYIVISQKLLTKDKLLCINKIRTSVDAIKIRYNPKNIESLKLFLPQELLYKLDVALKNEKRHR
jgi:hypothetical protein